MYTRTEGFDSESDIFTKVDYDALGRVTFESIPSDSANESLGTYYDHDELGRVIEKIVDQTDGPHTMDSHIPHTY